MRLDCMLSPRILRIAVSNPMLAAHEEAARLAYYGIPWDMLAQSNGDYLVWRTDENFSACVFVRE